MADDLAVWSCKIGPVLRSALPSGSDAPMRRVVEQAFEKLTGHPASACFSGWGARFDAAEQAVIDNTVADEDALVEEAIRDLRERGLLQAVVTRALAQVEV